MTRRRGGAGAGPRGSGPRRAGPKRWGDDPYGIRAKREGYPARSVYKLEEIDRRVRLFKRGQSVLDLGAFPGSWTLYAAKKVGSAGAVLGLDLQPFEGALPNTAKILKADLRERPLPIAPEQRFDVVLSDMAPATTGQRHVDSYRSYELATIALDLALAHLKGDGSFVAKIFQGEDFVKAKSAVSGSFKEVRVLRPKATRKESFEVFLFGRGLRSSVNGGSE